MILTRRNTTLLIGLGPLMAACSGTMTGAQISALVLNDSKTITAGLATALTNLEKQYPTLIPAKVEAALNKDVTMAAAVAAQLAAGQPAASAAVTVKDIVGYVNDALNVLAAPPINGLIPSPFNTAIAAVAFLAPELEAFAQSYIPTAASAATDKARVRLLLGAPIITSGNQARQILQNMIQGK